MEFLVQLEIKVAGSWRAAIRYDTAHGFTHIDRYNQKGEARKEVLKLSYSEALTRAERDIRGIGLSTGTGFCEEAFHEQTEGDG